MRATISIALAFLSSCAWRDAMQRARDLGCFEACGREGARLRKLAVAGAQLGEGCHCQFDDGTTADVEMRP